MSYHRKDTLYHFSLVLILILGILGTYYAHGDKQVQAMVISLTIVVYVIFALVHHYHTHTLSSKIVMEYISIGSLGLMLAVFFLKGFGL